MTTTNEQFVSDNSEAEKVSENLEESNSAPLEPETPEAVKSPECYADLEIPEKFRLKNGSANISALVKSYKELEPLLNEKANWVKEKEVLTSQISDLQAKNPNAVSDLSKMSVNLYETLMEKSMDSEKVKELIEQFKINPTKETLSEIEKLFPADVIREVFSKSTQLQDNVSKSYYQQQVLAAFQSRKQYLDEVVPKHFEELRNPMVAQIFGSAFLLLGQGLDAEWVFGKMQQLKESFYMDFQKEQSLKNEAGSALSTASSISPSSSDVGEAPLSSRNALDLSPQELDMVLDEYYSK